MSILSQILSMSVRERFFVMTIVEAIVKDPTGLAETCSATDQLP